MRTAVLNIGAAQYDYFARKFGPMAGKVAIFNRIEPELVFDNRTYVDLR